MPESVSTAADQTTSSQPGRSIQLTPDLVKKIADRVYALMQADLRIERERLRVKTQSTQEINHGGWYAG
jgi:hypothetical protein